MEVHMLSQRAIAKLAGTSQPTVSRVLSGKRYASPKLAKRLAKVLNIPIGILLEGDLGKIRCALEKSGHSI